MGFWDSSNFKRLNKAWREKLKESGFEDEEDEKGNLKSKDSRTALFKSRECTEEFYTCLAYYLNHSTNISDRDRQILNLYADGLMIKEIVYALGWSDRTVRNIISHHKVIFLRQS